MPACLNRWLMTPLLLLSAAAWAQPELIEEEDPETIGEEIEELLDDIDEPGWFGRNFAFGLDAAVGYFNFRDSLFVEIDPDPPGNLSDDWSEFFIKPYAVFESVTQKGTFFGMASWAYSVTDEDASVIAGGGASSADFDALYLGWRHGDPEDGQWEIAGGRYPYQLANGLLIADGYASGGSRGGYWTNPRTAWAPGGRLQYLRQGHMIETFYLERDERPESDTDSTVAGINYQWASADEAWTLGASYLSLGANELAAQRDGADVWNLRVYTEPLEWPLRLETEYVREDNGPLLDAAAFYLAATWAWGDIAWLPQLTYRYAWFEGDNPETAANEAYDPLFPGFTDWGTWWQGEIAGEYFISNSNLKTHMLHLRLAPKETVSTGLLYFDFKLDQPGSYQGGVLSDKLATEVNFYLDWRFGTYWTFNLVLARNQPGRAVEEAFNRTKAFKYGMIYLAFNY